MDEWLIGIVVLIFTLPLGWIVGRMGDPVWRCIQLRRILKHNYLVVKIVGKDNRSIDTRVINADKDVIIKENDMWTVAGSRIWRQGKKNEGFKVDPKQIKWEEGAPTVYVNSDSVIPLDFVGNVDEVKPNEVGSTLIAWVNNQLAKGLAQVQQIGLYLIIISLLCVGSLALSYMTYSELENKVIPAVAQMNATIVGGHSNIIPAGGTVSGGAININQGGAGGG